MTLQHGEPWVLVVDEDAWFRNLLSTVITRHGYAVYQARSASEANDAFKLGKPALAIIDFRLPDIDGISFIADLRSAGNDVMILFVSGTFCDINTFSRLRNLLKVSLILQKPVVPDLFAEQLENLLPKMQILEGETPAVIDQETLDQAAAQEETSEELKQALAEARLEFAQELPLMVQALAGMIRSARDKGNDPSLLKIARDEAHKIRGSSGSYGFKQVADNAEKIERLLGQIEPHESTMQDILWAEIIRLMADAEASTTAFVSASPPSSDLRPARRRSAHAVLVVTDSAETIDACTDLNINIAEAVVVNSLSNALLSLKAQRFDGIVLDDRICGEENVLDFTCSMRKETGHDALPIAFIFAGQSPYSPAELIYLGCSVIMQTPVFKDKFANAVQELISLHEPCLPRVLTVDDDHVLSDLTNRVLTSEGMIVQELNEPIRILDTLETFNPDIVLLDVIMPGLSGYDICRMLRATEKWKHLSVIFLTSKSDEVGRNAAFQAGADDFLAKPVVTSELISRVKGQAQKSPHLRQRLDRDSSTGLLQGETFVTVVSKMVLAAKTSNHPLTALLIEVKNLDQISKDNGAEVEQRIISTLGSLLQTRFRVEDAKALLARIFVLLIEKTLLETVEQAAQLLITEFENVRINDAQGQSLILKCRYGMSQMLVDADDAQQLLSVALERLRRT